MIISKYLAVIEKYTNQPKKSWQDAYQWIEDSNGENEKEDNNDISQTMWTGIPYYTKFEFNSGHQDVLNCTMLYLVALMITGLEFLEDRENDQINL